jgi:hypothetical protein
MIMNSPNATAASVHHLRVSGAKSLARIVLLERVYRP